MHMADALLSPTVGGTFWAATLGMIGYASRKLKANLDEKMIPLMGVLGAFIFAAQMINFTIPATGSSGHLGGGMILAIVLGPYSAFLVMASVLTTQALFFADGGLLALGCNIWNLGVYPCFIIYPLIYLPLVNNNASKSRTQVAGLLSGILALQMGAFSVVIETLLSGKSELPFGAFLLLMQPIHLAIGIVEGIVTAGVITYIQSARPEILEGTSGVSLKKLLVSFALLTLIIGGGLSLFASTNPDGLEWSITKVYGKPEIPGQEQGISPILKGVQEKTAFLPGYSFKGSGDTSSPNTGTSVSGIMGAAIVLGFVILIGIGIRAIRGRKS